MYVINVKTASTINGTLTVESSVNQNVNHVCQMIIVLNVGQDDMVLLIVSTIAVLAV